MKGMIRLALSSYIVIVAACTPGAVATPEPEMAPVQEVQLSVAESAPGETLNVSIRGPAAVRAATTAQYVASASNGATSSHHYYWWFIASCGKRNGCSPSSYTLLAEGLDQDTVSIRFGAASAEKDLVVQVAEIDGKRRTGSSVEFPIVGPSQRLGGGAAGFSGEICDWYAGSFYPHTGEFTDPFTGKSWERKFRRDYCSNRISWDPEG